MTAALSVTALCIVILAVLAWALHQGTAREQPRHRSGDTYDIADDTEHQAWLRSMTDPQTPEDYARAHEGAERLRAAMHEQALQQGDEFIHDATDGGGER